MLRAEREARSEILSYITDKSEYLLWVSKFYTVFDEGLMNPMKIDCTWFWLTEASAWQVARAAWRCQNGSLIIQKWLGRLRPNFGVSLGAKKHCIPTYYTGYWWPISYPFLHKPMVVFICTCTQTYEGTYLLSVSGTAGRIALKFGGHRVAH